jgi:hypothetical protein
LCAEDFWLETFMRQIVGDQHQDVENALVYWLWTAEQSESSPPVRMPGEFYQVYEAYAVDMLSAISAEI